MAADDFRAWLAAHPAGTFPGFSLRLSSHNTADRCLTLALNDSHSVRTATRTLLLSRCYPPHPPTPAPSVTAAYCVLHTAAAVCCRLCAGPCLPVAVCRRVVLNLRTLPTCVRAFPSAHRVPVSDVVVVCAEGIF